MSWINDQIESQLRNVRKDARMRPIIDQVTLSGQAGAASSDAVLAVAVRAARDSFVREGVKPTSVQVRERAFLAAAAAATESPMVLGDLPRGTDKTQHFFTSGVISLKLARIADLLLPRSWAEQLGIAGSVVLGWGKEVFDQFFGTGYNTDDLRADVAGARKPFKLAVPGEPQ